MSDKKRFTQIGIAIFMLSFVTVILQFLLGLFIRQLSIQIPESLSWLMFLLSMLPMYGVAVPVTIWIFKKVPSMEPLEKKKPSFMEMLVYLIICFSVMYLGNILGQILMYLVNLVSKTPKTFDLQEIILNNSIWVNMLVVVILAPIIEEYLFRKLLLDRIHGYGEGIAIFVSGLTFGLTHGNFFQFFYAFGVGVVFAYVYLKTGMVRYTIILHMIINFMGSVAAVFMLKVTGLDRLLAAQAEGVVLNTQDMMALLPGMIIFMIYAAILLLLMVTGIVLMIVFARKIYLKKGYVTMTRGKLLKTVFLNIGMMLFFCLCLVLFFF